jgi:CBS domain-containing protein
MNVGEICRRNVATVRPGDELLAAARLMREKHVGFLVAVEPAVKEKTWQPVGVLTDRDLVVSVLAREADPRTLCVGDVMTRKPVTVMMSDSVAHALHEMKRIGARRLPIVGDLGEMVGVIALDDIVEALAGQLQDVAGSIRTEQKIEKALRQS